MPADSGLVAAFLAAVACALVSVPVAARLAVRLNFHDKPGDYKQHARATPYLGGAGVLVACCAGLIVSGTGGFGAFKWILVGCGVLWVVGTYDDRHSLGPGVRLLIEVALGALLWHAGLGWEVGNSDLAELLLTILWVAGLVNAFNLMDNLDGAAASVSTACLVGIGLTAKLDGAMSLAVMAAALAGALLGFLRMNLSSPARIFLGDGGSMPIGFAVAAMTMALPVSESAGVTGLLAGGLMVGLPVLDVFLVVVSRRRARVPVARGGRDHLTHRIYAKVGSARLVAGSLGLVQLALAASAVLLLEYGSAGLRIGVALGFLAAGAGIVALLETPNWAPERPALADDPATESSFRWSPDKEAAAEAF